MYTHAHKRSGGCARGDACSRSASGARSGAAKGAEGAEGAADDAPLVGATLAAARELLPALDAEADVL